MALLGCIADDFTGGTDLAINLTKAGFRTVQTIGVPRDEAPPADADAIVVALKTRTCPPDEAIHASLAALSWLRGLGCRQFYFKYCSTFDSTPRGNIGPVTEALLGALGESFTIACPAFPENGRTVYRGHLFVHNALLSESGMEKHPLTPMLDPNIPRVLGRQTTSRVGLVDCDAIALGAGFVTGRFQELAAEGVRIAVTDTLTNSDLATIAAAAKPLRLLTGGSALARALGANFDREPSLSRCQGNPPANGRRAILAGSCSRMTLRQLEHVIRRYPSRRLDPGELADDFDATIAAAVRWAEQALELPEPVMIYCSGTPQQVAASQQLLGIECAGGLCERALAKIATEIVDRGVNRLVLAGGETSGAVVRALGITQLEIGPEIDPGVPWTFARARGQDIAVAMKSGNFGSEQFFTEAWDKLGASATAQPLS